MHMGCTRDAHGMHTECTRDAEPEAWLLPWSRLSRRARWSPADTRNGAALHSLPRDHASSLPGALLGSGSPPPPLWPPSGPHEPHLHHRRLAGKPSLSVSPASFHFLLFTRGKPLVLDPKGPKIHMAFPWNVQSNPGLQGHPRASLGRAAPPSPLGKGRKHEQHRSPRPGTSHSLSAFGLTTGQLGDDGGHCGHEAPRRG